MSIFVKSHRSAARRSRTRTAVRTAAALGVMVLAGHPTPSVSDQAASVIGCSVGSSHPYCTDPAIVSLRQALDAAWPEAQRALGTATIVDQDATYQRDVMSCGADRVCLVEVVADRVGSLRGWAYPDPGSAPALKRSDSAGAETAAPADVDAAEVAELLGCDGSGDLARCSDPTIVGLATDRIASAREMMEADPGMAATDAVDRSMLSRALDRCVDDISCLRQALAMSTESVRGMAGLPPRPAGGGTAALDDAVLAVLQRAEEAARAERKSRMAAAAAEAKAVEERQAAEAALQNEALAKQAHTTAEAYTAEWTAATRTLAPYPSSLEAFARIYESPEDWIARRDRECSADPACLAMVAFDRDRMAATAARELERGRALAAVQAKRDQELAEEAARLEERRREAEARQQEAAERFKRAMSNESLDRIFPPDSLLLHLIRGEFESLDQKLRELVAREYTGNISTTIELLAPGRAEEIRAGIIGNRRNLFAASYAVTRFRVLGACGDPVVKAYVRSVSGTETRTLSGRVVDRTEGFEVYIDIPRKFARYIRRTGVDDSDLFAEEVEALGCQHPARHVVEDNLVAFAEGRDFIPWQK